MSGTSDDLWAADSRPGLRHDLRWRTLAVAVTALLLSVGPFAPGPPV